MYHVISQCPVCGKPLKAVRLKCDHCDTSIENDFRLSKFDYLSSEDLYFVETFLKCRGNIKEVERELRISYPTVRSKLDDVISKLGFQPQAPVSTESRADEVLDALERGEISPEEALEQLNKEKGDLKNG